MFKLTDAQRAQLESLQTNGRQFMCHVNRRYIRTSKTLQQLGLVVVDDAHYVLTPAGAALLQKNDNK